MSKMRRKGRNMKVGLLARSIKSRKRRSKSNFCLRIKLYRKRLLETKLWKMRELRNKRRSWK